jgi:hypothetical protein
MEKKTSRSRSSSGAVLKMVPGDLDTPKRTRSAKNKSPQAASAAPTAPKKAKGAPVELTAEQSVALGWTPARKKAVTEHLSALQPKLRLQEWTIKVRWDKYSDEFDDAYATNTPLGDSRHCEVRFSKKFLELDSEEMTQVIIHELMHCHLFALEDYTTDVVEEIAPKRIAAVFNIGHNKLTETTIDAIADAFTGLLPVIVFPQR